MDAGSAIAKPFLARIEAPPPMGFLAFRMGRGPLAWLLAAIPLVVVGAAALFGPVELRRAITSHENVQQTFARFVTAIATASAIAVSIASLTLRREIAGVGELRQRHDDNHAYRRRVRAGASRAPLHLGSFLAFCLDAIARHARRARDAATGEQLASSEEGVTLAELLEGLELRASSVAQRLRASRGRPDRMLSIALDFEVDVASHLVRVMRREAEGSPLAAALQELEERLEDYVIASRYAKSMDTCWGLSNMSWAILVSTVPSLLAASLMVLAYGQGAVDVLGLSGAGLLVGFAMSVSILPIAFFVSYVLRFVFLNEHTLPTDGFVLGPEAWDVVKDRSAPLRKRETTLP